MVWCVFYSVGPNLGVQVPIRQRSEAIAWLHAQKKLPRLFFSGRGGRGTDAGLNGAGGRRGGSNVVGVAGVGSAVYFRQIEPFSLEDWKCIKRYACCLLHCLTEGGGRNRRARLCC